MTPPSVSTPSQSGVTSRRRTSFIAGENARLHGCADRDHFVRVNTLVRLAAEEAAVTISCTFGIRV